MSDTVSDTPVDVDDSARLAEARGISLGWCAESGVMPRKREEIKGVSAASIVSLRAQLFRGKEEAATARASRGGESAVELRMKHRGALGDLGVKSIKLDASDGGLLPGGRNQGVDERARRDAAQRRDTSARAVHASLSRKAALYEKLAAGGVYDGDDAEDEKYAVDFFAKANEARVDRGEGGGATWGYDYGAHPGGGVERDRVEPGWRCGGRPGDDATGEEAVLRPPPEPEPGYDRRDDRIARVEAAEREAAERRARERAIVHEVSVQTEIGRSRAAALKLRREKAEEQRRGKIEAAFIRKHMAKARAERAERLTQEAVTFGGGGDAAR